VQHRQFCRPRNETAGKVKPSVSCSSVFSPVFATFQPSTPFSFFLAHTHATTWQGWGGGVKGGTPYSFNRFLYVWRALSRRPAVHTTCVQIVQWLCSQRARRGDFSGGHALPPIALAVAIKPAFTAVGKVSSVAAPLPAKPAWHIPQLPERLQKLANALIAAGGKMGSDELAEKIKFDPSRISHDYTSKRLKDWIKTYIVKESRGVYCWLPITAHNKNTKET